MRLGCINAKFQVFFIYLIPIHFGWLDNLCLTRMYMRFRSARLSIILFEDNQFPKEATKCLKINWLKFSLLFGLELHLSRGLDHACLWPVTL